MNKTEIIAEISSNHGGDFEKAIEMINSAKRAGADFVKFQSYFPDSLTINCNSDCFLINHPKWGGQTLYELYSKAYTPIQWIPQLKKHADDIGIKFFCSVFDKRSIDFLEKLDIEYFKIASFEIIDHELIKYAAQACDNIIISTGMATVEEIHEAVDVAKESGAKKIVLFKCTSGYPADPKDVNLNTIPHMIDLFKCPVGFSDHTLGIGASISAVLLGACMIEKHFILSKKDITDDSFFSLDSEEFCSLVKEMRAAECSVGDVFYGVSECEKNSLVFRRSLFVVEEMKEGDIFTQQNVKSIRPGNGLKPKYKNEILGLSCSRDIRRGTPMRWNLIRG